MFHILDKDKNILGSVSRTSPTGDEIVGYNGPTDTRLLFNPDGALKQFRTRDTDETKQYADDVRDDEYFNDLFNGKTL